MITKNLRAGVIGKKFWKKFMRKYKLIEYDAQVREARFVDKNGKEFSIGIDTDSGFIEITRESRTNYVTLYVDMYDMIAPGAIKRAVEIILNELDDIFRGDDGVCDKSSKGSGREDGEISAEVIQEVLRHSAKKRSNKKTRK